MENLYNAEASPLENMFFWSTLIPAVQMGPEPGYNAPEKGIGATGDARKTLASLSSVLYHSLQLNSIDTRSQSLANNSRKSPTQEGSLNHSHSSDFSTSLCLLVSPFSRFLCSYNVT